LKKDAEIISFGISKIISFPDRLEQVCARRIPKNCQVPASERVTLRRRALVELPVNSRLMRARRVEKQGILAVKIHTVGGSPELEIITGQGRF